MGLKISIHALREEGDAGYADIGDTEGISIHALREEGDLALVRDRWQTEVQFLSTPSARRATYHKGIDIGAPLDFYPRPPRGGRQPQALPDHKMDRFLSTPSARRATGDMYHTMQSACYFYPRPPRGGRLITHRCTHTTTLNFYPRPPRGGRPQRLRRAPQLRRISIHALREEGDRLSAEWIQEDTKFLSTPSARRAT